MTIDFMIMSLQLLFFSNTNSIEYIGSDKCFKSRGDQSSKTQTQTVVFGVNKKPPNLAGKQRKKIDRLFNEKPPNSNGKLGRKIKQKID